jgi:hypothetical protein
MGKIIAFVLTALLFSLTTFLVVNPSENLVQAQTGTQVGGIITSDTTWSAEGSPYIFVDNVTVAQGVTLTIKSGTVVDLQFLSFIIDGTLNARGDETNKIILQAQKRQTWSWPPRIYFNTSSTPWDETTGTGCIIDHAQINVPTFQYEAILGGYPKISNNIIYNYGNDAAAIRTNGLVVSNIIMGGYRGIYAENGSIYYNTVKDADVGICCGFGSPDPIYHPTIIGNLIFNNSIGIEDWGSHLYIMNNSIINNQVGFRFTSYTFYRDTERKDVNYNNVYGNSRVVVVEFSNTSRTINMVNCWWGTTDESIIAQSIVDTKNQTSLNTVTFIPFLSQPVTQEIDFNSIPTSPPVNDQTTTPTPQSIVQPNMFSIQSNSTVSALSYNGTSEIVFTVSGPTGTTGYVNATISKNFMSNGEAIQVYLDGNLIDCNVTSSDDFWVIYFSYHHSLHNVRINQIQTQTNPSTIFDSAYWLYIEVGLLVALTVFLSLIVWAAKTNRKK